MNRVYNLEGMENFKKYFKNDNIYSPKSIGSDVRKVNQPEMLEFIKLNPEVTEAEIQVVLYNFYRYNNINSNKKYADCLRRLLDSGKISRKKNNKGRFVYFLTPKKTTECRTLVQWCFGSL